MDLENVPANTKAGLVMMNQGKVLASLSKQEREELAQEIVHQYLEGHKTDEIAKALNVSRPRVYQVVVEHAQDAWKAAQISLALERREQANEDLATAKDGLELARAREQLRSAQWDLERVFRRVFGDEKAQINIGGEGIQVQIVSYGSNKEADKPAIDVTPEGK